VHFSVFVVKLLQYDDCSVYAYSVAKLEKSRWVAGNLWKDTGKFRINSGKYFGIVEDSKNSRKTVLRLALLGGLSYNAGACAHARQCLHAVSLTRRDGKACQRRASVA